MAWGGRPGAKARPTGRDADRARSGSGPDADTGGFSRTSFERAAPGDGEFSRTSEQGGGAHAGRPAPDPGGFSRSSDSRGRDARGRAGQGGFGRSPGKRLGASAQADDASTAIIRSSDSRSFGSARGRPRADDTITRSSERRAGAALRNAEAREAARVQALNDEFETARPRDAASALPDDDFDAFAGASAGGIPAAFVSALADDDFGDAAPPPPGTTPPAGSGLAELAQAAERPRGPSLKARAVGYLSRREHSRTELARKLARWTEDTTEIDTVLDALAREGFLSADRFVQSVVHRRAPRLGTARVLQELRQHGIADAELAEVKASLRASEAERARAVWQKRFGERPADREAWARQARFLAARGFSHDIIRRILGED